MNLNEPFLLSDEFPTMWDLLVLQAGAGSKLSETEITGNPVAFNTNVAKPLSAFTIPFLPMQSGTGDPSPDNVRPVSGRSGVTVGLCTGNLFNLTAVSKEENGVKWEVNGDTIEVSGTASGYTNLYCGSVNVEGLRSIRVSGLDGHSTNVQWDCRLENGNGEIVANVGSYIYDYTVDLTQYPTAKRLSISIKRNENAAVSGSIRIQVEPGTGTTEYKEYAEPKRYSVVFPALGKNLFDKNAQKTAERYLSENGSEVVFSGWSITDYIPVSPPFTISPVSGNSPSICVYDEEKNFLYGEKYATGGTGQNPKSITINVTGARYCRFSIPSNGSWDDSIMLNEGSTAEPYEPFDNTVYGGTLDAVNGVLTVEWKSVDLGSLQWVFNRDTSVRQSWDAYLSNVKEQNGNVAFDGMCESFKSASYNATWTPYIVAEFGGRVYITFEPSAYANASEVREALSGVLLVYPLATPYEIPLSDIPVPVTLIGDNTIWTDTNGENTIKYKKKG